MEEAGITGGKWTQSDSEQEYMSWINRIRAKIKPRGLAEWENDAWLKRAMAEKANAAKPSFPRCCKR
jgi:hypothetical protein